MFKKYKKRRGTFKNYPKEIRILYGRNYDSWLQERIENILRTNIYRYEIMNDDYGTIVFTNKYVDSSLEKSNVIKMEK